MIQYVCDTCSVVKGAGEVWLVGLAADAVGVTSGQLLYIHWPFTSVPSSARTITWLGSSLPKHLPKR